MTNKEKLQTLSPEAQKVVKQEAAILADVGHELIFIETGVGYWKPYFYDTCLGFAIE